MYPFIDVLIYLVVKHTSLYKGGQVKYLLCGKAMVTLNCTDMNMRLRSKYVFKKDNGKIHDFVINLAVC